MAARNKKSAPSKPATSKKKAAKAKASRKKSASRKEEPKTKRSGKVAKAKASAKKKAGPPEGKGKGKGKKADAKPEAKGKGKAKAKAKGKAKAKTKQADAKPELESKSKSKSKSKPKPKPEPESKSKSKQAKGAAQTGSDFAGFPPEGLQFLAELGANNEREWFVAHKDRYEAHVLAPALAFIRAMRPRLAAISKEFLAVDKKVGGSLMRIHRDTRFAADKTPYKTNIGIQFRHSGGKDVHAPGFYVHIEPGEAFLGCGLWRPDKDPLQSIRQAIADTPEAWSKVIGDKTFRGYFELAGESLQRPPKGFDPEHPMIEHIKRKDHIATCSLQASVLHDAALVEHVAERFAAVAPYVRFLCDAVGASF